MEYLKLAQDLEMYGINYFQIKVSELYLYVQLSVVCHMKKLSQIAHT